MKIIQPSCQFETPIDGDNGLRLLQVIERAARTCYKSEGKIGGPDETRAFVRKMVHVRKHESVIEHQSTTVRFVIDRGVSHELVRHRIGAYSQESTRYCCYGNDKFGNEITVIQPPFYQPGTVQYFLWRRACETAEEVYMALLDAGSTPQEARSVLPNSLKTEVVTTYNMRQWRHLFRMRTSPAAHPQMRQVMIPLLAEFKKHLPELFDDIEVPA